MDGKALRRVAQEATTIVSLADATGGERWRLDWPDEVTAFIGEFDPPTVLALLDRLEAAEAAVERVRALADEWESWSHGRSTPRIDAFRDAADDLRAELEGA